MKRFVSIAVLMVVIAFAGKNAMAQNFKFGHINSDELIQAMPEYDSATVKLEKFRKELVNALELMGVELNNKNEAYQKDSKNLSDIVKQTKEQELVDMQKRIQDFQNNAQTQLQNKQTEVFQPIYAKVDKAIKDVGKENGFLYVFDIAKGALLYYDETKSINVMPLVKTKLGLK
ncbi:MAG TPA: OmpH family outer membrane protein [Bacteroidales bacterium]|nr:OmpH family outer membrane protein [Bacteroidales bacterium]